MIKRSSTGFTLVEMLVVMAVIVILIAAVVPAATGILRGNKVTQAIEAVESQFNLARQAAVAANRTVEIRLYQYIDPSQNGSAATFNALQAFTLNGSTLTPTENVQKLPSTVIMDSGATLSSLLNPTAQRPLVQGKLPLPDIGKNYTYIAFRFRPDGSTDLLPTTGPWFLTLHESLRGDKLTAPPSQFATVEIDPVSGELRLYRP